LNRTVIAALIAITTAKSRKSVRSVISVNRNQFECCRRNGSKQILADMIAHEDGHDEPKHPQKRSGALTVDPFDDSWKTMAGVPTEYILPAPLPAAQRRERVDGDY
jgi:hypothetical protein